MAISSSGLRPTHPGEVLREDVLPALGKSKAAIARSLGVSPRILDGLLSESRPITARLAIRLGKLIGNGPDLWLRMQLAYDLATMVPAMAEELERIPTLQAAP